MSINSQFQTGSFTHRVAVLKSQSMVEIKLAGQDMVEVVAVCPQLSLSSCEVSSGRVNYGGRLIVTVVYTDAEGKLCRIQKGAEFSHYADDERLAPAQRGYCRLVCEREQVRRDGSGFAVAVVVGAEISVYDSAQRSYLSSIDGAICRTDSAKLYSMVNFSGESEVEDDFDCVASDVLIPSAQALVLDCNARAGVVEVSGEIYLALLAVRDGAPVSLDRIIPFKCELPCDEALLSKRACCSAEVKALNVNCKVNEERGKCTVDFDATLAFSGHFFEEEEASCVCDAFCSDSELNLSFNEEKTTLDTDIKVYSERVAGPCAAKAKIDYTCAFLAAAMPRAEFERTPDGAEGSITATLLYEQGGEVHSTEVNMPFSVALSGLSDSCRTVSVAVCGMSLRQRAEGESRARQCSKFPPQTARSTPSDTSPRQPRARLKARATARSACTYPPRATGFGKRQSGWEKVRKASSSPTPTSASLSAATKEF